MFDKESVKKFIEYHEVEWHRYEHHGYRDIQIYLSFYQIDEFCGMIDDDYYCEDRIDSELYQDYIGIWMLELFEYHDVKLVDVFGEAPC